MLEKKLDSIIRTVLEQKCENSHLEIKKAGEGCPRLFDTLSSFSNQKDGGVILFGIDEKKDFQVCGVYDAADLIKKISEQCLQMEPPVKALCTTTVFDGKAVVSAEIPEIDDFQKPCFYKGGGRLRGSFVRVGESDRQMTEYEVYTYEAFKKKIEDELRVVERAGEKELRTDALKKYMLELREKKPVIASHGTLPEFAGIRSERPPDYCGTPYVRGLSAGIFPRALHYGSFRRGDRNRHRRRIRSQVHRQQTYRRIGPSNA